MHFVRAATVALIVLALTGCGAFQIAPKAPEPLPNPSWTMEGVDAAGRARVETAAPKSWNHFGILNFHNKRSNFRMNEFSSPLVVGKNIYVASTEKTLHAIRWKDGKDVWAFPMKGRVVASLAWWNGLIFCADDEGQLVAVDQQGTERWRFVADYPILSSPIVVNGRVYVLIADQNLFCLNASTGVPIWQHEQADEPVQGAIWRGGSLSAAEGLIFVGFADGMVLALDAEVGQVRWRKRITQRKLFPDVIAGPVYDKGRVYAGTRDGPLVALDAANGSEVWVNEGPTASGMAVGLGRVYVGLPEGGVRAVNDETGETVWTRAAKGGLTSPPLLAADEVIVGTEEAGIGALDAATGELKRYYTPGPGVSSRAWVGEAGMLFLSNGGAIHRVKNGR